MTGARLQDVLAVFDAALRPGVGRRAGTRWAWSAAIQSRRSSGSCSPSTRPRQSPQRPSRTTPTWSSCTTRCFLTPVSSVAATTPKGRVLHSLMSNQIALLTAHTNADTPAHGVNDVARPSGRDRRAAHPAADGRDRSRQARHLRAARARREAVRRPSRSPVQDASATTTRCTFTTVGEGRFRPLDGREPDDRDGGRARGRRGVADRVGLPACAARDVRRRDAGRAPLRGARVRRARARGRVCAGNPRTRPDRRPRRADHAAGFAETVSAALPATAHGVRAPGDPDRVVAPSRSAPARATRCSTCGRAPARTCT